MHSVMSAVIWCASRHLTSFHMGAAIAFKHKGSRSRWVEPGATPHKELSFFLRPVGEVSWITTFVIMAVFRVKAELPYM